MQILQAGPMHDDEPASTIILTVKETAALLKISERTGYAMAREGRLHGAAKIGGSWRVQRVKLRGWLEAGGDSPHVTQRDPGAGGET